MSAYLDSFPLLNATVGYGQLGTGGDLGYENKQVSVQSRRYEHALSTHGTARLIYRLDGRFGRFQCQVAINDDVMPGGSSADFSVRADGRMIAVAPDVTAGDVPRKICADLGSARILELVVDTARWSFCHAVWLDPVLDQENTGFLHPVLSDCLGRAAIDIPPDLPRADLCIATMASSGFESLLDDMLGSLLANSGCHDALLAVFCIGDCSTVAPVAVKYGAILIHCDPLQTVSMSSKSVLYSVARVVEAEYYLCLDADTLILGDLRPLFAMLKACPEGTVLACREDNCRSYRHLSDAFQRLYHGDPNDLPRLARDDAAAYPLVVNDGVFAGSRTALLALDTAIRAMQDLHMWMNDRPDIGWRNQFLFNHALAESGCGIELGPAYNLQLNRNDVRMFNESGRPQAEWNGKRVAIVHFNGDGRHKHDEWHGIYARVGRGFGLSPAGDAYARFLNVLRSWVGVHGVGAMAWSFYGTPDGRGAQLSDTGAMPLLGLLHYLIRSNGCQRVMETGTARGVSAACIASAVAHRLGARVVSFDPCHYPERDQLWAALPDKMRCCLEARVAGSLEGMAAALDAGESYEAALLDSIHTSEHVWAEFELARRLVCPGGLILVHDARCAAGTVAQALGRIAAAGYGVTRLWTADGGLRADAELGLAVIENRLQPASSPA